MICYKDMTFCDSDCTNTLCVRLFTKKTREAADKWWGGPNAPVAFSDFSKGCKWYKGTEHE